MIIKLKYFASLGDAFQKTDETLEIPSSELTVFALKKQLSGRGTVWQTKMADSNTRCAVNQALANDGTLIPDQAEVAFFPPVTGG